MGEKREAVAFPLSLHGRKVQANNRNRPEPGKVREHVLQERARRMANKRDAIVADAGSLAWEDVLYEV